jgi:hypothetical protein
LGRQLGQWTEKDLNRQERRWETLGTLLWTLSLSPEMPPYDAHFNREAIFRQGGLAPSRPESYQSFLHIARLRPKVHGEFSRPLSALVDSQRSAHASLAPSRNIHALCLVGSGAGGSNVCDGFILAMAFAHDSL